MRDDRLYLSNIFECIERIESYTQDGKEAFLQTTLKKNSEARIQDSESMSGGFS